MSDDVLKRCPFCGNPPVILTTREDDSFERCAEVRCDTCGIALGDEYRADAIQLWNTRATLTASRSYSDEIEEVTQADRDAAGDMILWRGLGRDLANQIRRGEADDDYTVQAFRAHRVSTLSKVKDQV